MHVRSIGTYLLSCAATITAISGCGIDDDSPELGTAQQALSMTGGVLTQHVDPARTGLNPNETQLTWGSVQNNFGRLFSVAVDGRVFAQPLYAPQVATATGARDLAIVATAANTVYAIDAHSGAIVWQRNLGTPIPSLDAYPSQCLNIPGTIGITGTPVIDPSSGTLYVVSATKAAGYHQNLHALDLASGTPRGNSPREITAQAPGDGPAAVDGVIAFDPLRANQRPGLLLLGGKVYVGWASHCDDAIDFIKTPSQPEIFFGWLMSFDATTLARTAVFNTVPHADPANSIDPYGGAIWHGAGGIASDGTEIYANTGNGLFQPATNDWGDSTLAFTPNLTLADSFTPFDQSTLDTSDLDMSAGGVVIVPTSVPQHPNLLVSTGKKGTIYVLDRDHLGGAQTFTDAQCPANQAPGNCVVGEGFEAIGIQGDAGAFFGQPAYFNGRLYFAGNHDHLKAFSVGGGSPLSLALAQTTTTFLYPGATPSISANGASDAIVWAIERTQPEPFTATDPTNLHAYRADTLTELYNSSAFSESPGTTGQFITPTVAGGEVVIGTSSSIVVYGNVLQPSPASQSVIQGNSTTFTIATPFMNPAPSIALAVTGLPAGATAAFSAGTITGGASSILTITAASTTAPGTYGLTITGTTGTRVRTTAVTLVVVHRDLPPTSAFTVTCAGRRCSFDASSSSDAEGPIANYSWMFGDGTPAVVGPSNAIVTHLFPSAGTYSVTLGVLDGAGQSASTAQTVTVVDAFPVAAFSFACTVWHCTFNATASSDIEGPIASYSWNFGDGSPAVLGAIANHSFTANGTYSVRLTVTDSAGQAASSTHAVQVVDLPPVAAFSFGCAIWQCAFNATGSSDAEGAIASYSWSFGDGSQAVLGAIPSHQFTASGTYSVTLTVTDSIGQAASITHPVRVVDLPPFPIFSTVCIDLTCTADSEGSSDDVFIAGYRWDWGDGATTSGGSPASAPSHSYAAYGSYTITLTETDSIGQTASTTRTVTVTPPPVAAFTFSCTGLICRFDASGSIRAVQYHWDWDDETTLDATTAMASHRFSAAGTFNVHLTVTDASGVTGGVTQAVTVVRRIGVPIKNPPNPGPIDPPPPEPVPAVRAGTIRSAGAPARQR